MIIPCPYCGRRHSSEFSYLGDASVMQRPDFDASEETWSDYIYLRDNPAGIHKELWRHSFGCGSWFIVERNTLTHEVLSVVPAKGRP